MIIAYLAGPYTGKYHDHRSYFEIDQHISVARETAARLARAGIGFFAPHLNSAHFEVITPEVTPEFWYDMDTEMLTSCTCMLMLAGWEQSQGAVAEKFLAEECGIPVFEDIVDLIVWAHEGVAV